jgi:hypothetical protein
MPRPAAPAAQPGKQKKKAHSKKHSCILMMSAESCCVFLSVLFFSAYPGCGRAPWRQRTRSIERSGVAGKKPAQWKSKKTQKRKN